MTIQTLLDSVGAEIDDPDEEAFLLFSQSIPSQSLGFVDAKATSLDVTINGRDLSIRQSPTILSSNREGGTTGAVVWKVTPLFALWITSPNSPLFKYKVLSEKSTVLELGCGISAIIALTLGPFIRSYVLTDQEYVRKLVNQNLTENVSPSTNTRKGSSKSKRTVSSVTTAKNNVIFKTLDWENDEVSPSLAGPDLQSFDAIIACDCIYNDALIQPLVQACVDLCQLRVNDIEPEPTLCIVAQQLRSAEVFESWLKAFYSHFRVWRVPDSELSVDLQSNSGFAVHLGILR